MLMMRPALPGGARYRGCRTANIRHLDVDASFWFWTPKMMHHFDFGQRSNDASCRLVWTYGGLVTKIGSGDACDACANRCERKETDAACQRKETHWREEVPQIRSQSGNFRWLRFLLLCILHSVTSWHFNENRAIKMSTSTWLLDIRIGPGLQRFNCGQTKVWLVFCCLRTFRAAIVILVHSENEPIWRLP